MLNNIALLLPLLAMAGSSAAYVYKQYLDRIDQRRQRFFELLEYLDTPGSLATKLAAIYQLRSYPEHGDFIQRFCIQVMNNVDGSAAKSLQKELMATYDFFVES